MFSQVNVNRVNANVRMDFHNNGSNEWLGSRLELIGSSFLCVSALFLILLPSSIIRPGRLSTKMVCVLLGYIHLICSLSTLCLYLCLGS